MRKSQAGILASAMFTLYAVAAEAQTANAPSVADLGTIMVTETRTERALAEASASISVVGPSQIQATPAQSLDDVLRTVPSLNLPDLASYQVHPTANSVSMRGLGGQRALVMQDGVPINDPFFGYVQWTRVPMESVDRVEIVRGGGSSLWGNYAMGGVVNIITRTPRATEFAADAGYGRFDTTRVNAYGATTGNEALALNASVNYFNTAGYNQVPQDLRAPLDVPTASRNWNGQVTANLRADASLTGYLRANYFDADQTLGTPLSTNAQRTWSFAGGLTKKLDPVTALTGTLFANNSRFSTNNVDTPEGFAPRYAEYIQNAHTTPVKDIGGSLQWSTYLSPVLPLLSFGADYHFIKGEDDASINDQFGTLVRTDIGRGKQELTGAFAQASIAPMADVEILASARQEYFRNFDGFDGNPGGMGNVPATSATAFSPRIALRYQVSTPIALRAAYYGSFRAPNLDNLYRAFSIPGGIFEPNAALVPEKLRGGEVGIDWQTRALRTQLTLFYNQITNLITSRALTDDELPPGFFFGSRNINAGKSRAYGVDLTADYAINSQWSANLGYAFAHSTITENPIDPLSVGRQIDGIPRNALSGSLTYAAPSGFKASLRGRYVQQHYGNGSFNLIVPSYAVFDLSLAYAPDKRYEFFLNIENLLDRTYIASNDGFSPPQLGKPFAPFVGIRLRYF